MNTNFSKNDKSILDISQIVHDIKNPLTTIMASVDFLKSNKVSEKDKQQFYDMIESESRNILDFINDILEVSKIENDPKIKSDEKCNMALVVSKVLKDLKPFSSKKNIKVQVEISENLVLDMPKIRIKQILSNLISNSIKYNKNGGKLIIKSYKKENFVSIEVEDTGIGISDKDKNKIFEKFYRSEEAKKLNIKGTGLGLSIINNIVSAYGGKIRVFSTLGKGSKFIVSLPLS